MTSGKSRYTETFKQRYQNSIPCLLFGVLFLFTGCTSAPRLPTFPVGQADQYQHVLSRDGLQIAVDPMFDTKKNKTYFGVDLLQENILPVFVLVENANAKGSYVVFNDKISLSGLENDQLSVNDKLKSNDITKEMTLSDTSAFVGGVPLLLVALSQISDSAEIKRNFKSKGFQTQTLSVGKQCSGFVYFRFPEKTKGGESLSVRIEMMNLQSKENQIYQVPIIWKGKSQ